MPIAAPVTCASAVAELRSITLVHDVSCAWVCMHALLYCIDPHDKHNPAVRAMLGHQMWEAQCKVELTQRFDLTGQVAVVAGLFFGDWLPPLAAAVGPSGLVVGFEPSQRNVYLARATAAANRLSNTRVVHACLSSTHATQQMCVRDRAGKLLGGQSALLPGAMRGGLVFNGSSNRSRTQCREEETVECMPLDTAAQWASQSQRVGLVMLDFEGHEEAALEGAQLLIRKWLPVVATKTPIVGRPIFGRLLQPLGYQANGQCPGFNYYTSPGVLVGRK